ncbi:MAG: DUF4406 domain-containing protein [bacterium]|nr:DUF4406 domain-containing protein [bacterium]
MATRPLVFISHPIRGDVEANIESTCHWMRWAIRNKGVSAIAPYIGLLKALNEDDPKERDIGIEIGMDVLLRCDELWLVGTHISEGMQKEADFAHKHDIRVIYGYINRTIDEVIE